MRVVFDSNVFVSALTLSGGAADRALARILEGRDELVISKPIVREVLDVLAQNFARDAEQLARTALFLSDLGRSVSPRRRLSVLRDDADNRVLECALAGGAEAIVTGDRRMLELGEHAGVRIISLRRFNDS